jgi:hypothetical protein
MDNGKQENNSKSDIPYRKISLVCTIVFLIVLIVLAAVFLGPWLDLPWWMILILSVLILLSGAAGIIFSNKILKEMHK